MKKTPPRKQPRTDDVRSISDEALARVTGGVTVPKLSGDSKENGY